MGDVFQKLADIEKGGMQAALAIVIRTKGSTPRKAGAKMIVLEDGSILGTLGGGGLEKKVIEESIEAMKTGKAKLTSFTLEENLDMMCGGEIEIYIEPIIQPERLIIFGAGHITKALTPLMRSVGFRVTVVDECGKAPPGWKYLYRNPHPGLFEGQGRSPPHHWEGFPLRGDDWKREEDQDHRGGLDLQRDREGAFV